MKFNYFLIFLKLLPEKWANTKKLAIQAKQDIAKLITTEVANIRSKVANYEIEQHDLRELFKQDAPLKHDCIDHYAKLDLVSS